MTASTIETAVTTAHSATGQRVMDNKPIDNEISHRRDIAALILSSITDQLTMSAQKSYDFNLFLQAAMHVAYGQEPASNTGAYDLGYEYMSSRLTGGDGKLDDEYIIKYLERMAAENPLSL